MGAEKNKRPWLGGYDRDYFKDNENKIELTHCKEGGINCKNHRTFINKRYRESNIYYRNKEYRKSAEALKQAYLKTFEIEQPQCQNCARLFRATIIESLEKMHGALRKISTGLFGSKRNKLNFEMINETLNNLKQREGSFS